jgi:hypothetical protein
MGKGLSARCRIRGAQSEKNLSCRECANEPFEVRWISVCKDGIPTAVKSGYFDPITFQSSEQRDKPVSSSLPDKIAGRLSVGNADRVVSEGDEHFVRGTDCDSDHTNSLGGPSPSSDDPVLLPRGVDHPVPKSSWRVLRLHCPRLGASADPDSRIPPVGRCADHGSEYANQE